MSTVPDAIEPRLIILRDPLSPSRSREVVPCERGQWLAAVVPTECLTGHWVAVCNGAVLERQAWETHLLVPGEEVLVYPKLQGTVGKIVSGIVFPPLGVYWALRHAGLPTWASGLLTGGPIGMQFFPSIENIMSGRSSAPANKPATTTDLSSSPTYGFSGITNSTRIGAPISVVYGRHRVGGQLLNSFVTTNDNSDVIHMLLALSEGEIFEVVNIEINEQPLANYTGVTYDVRKGTNGQSSIGLFGDKSATTFSADSSLTTTMITYTTQGTNLTGFSIRLIFPGGLFRLDTQGRFDSTEVPVEVDYKLTSSGTWIAGPRVTYAEAKRAALRFDLRVDNLSRGQYDIRIRRTTTESTDSNKVDSVRRESITELTNDGYTYPNTALLSVSAMATNQLSGGMPRVTAEVLGVKVKIWFSDYTYVVGYTQNPAWVVFDMLTNERYGHGRFTWRTTYRAGGLTVTNGSRNFSGTGTGWTATTLRKGDVLHDPYARAIGIVDTINYATQTGTFLDDWGGEDQGNEPYEVKSNDIDILSFVEWAEFCDELVPDGHGGMEPRAQCDMVFDADGETLWPAVLRICGIGQASLAPVGNTIRIKIERAESPVQLFTMANVKADSFEEVFLPLKERSNIFEVQFLNAANGYRQDMVVLEDPLLFTNSEQPRRKTVSGYGITRSSHAARLARFSQRANRYVTRTITFEVGLDAVACEPGDVISFQHDVPQWGYGGRVLGGSTSTTIVLDHPVTLVSGKVYEVLIVHRDDTRETKTVTTGAGTVSTLTISGSWAQIPSVHEIWAFGEKHISTKPFRVVTIERTQDLDARITAIEYVEAVYDESELVPANAVQYSALTDLMGPPGQVKHLTILEQDGTDLSVWVSFSPPGSANFKTANIYRVDSGAKVLLGQSSTGAFPVSGLRGGERFTVKVTSVSSLGGESSYASAPTASIVVTSVNPPNVPTLVLEGDRLRWNYPNPPRDLAGFLVRFRPGTSQAWSSATPAHNNLLLSTDLQIFRRQGIQTFLVKAVDKYGNESLIPKSLTVSFDAAETENIVIETNHRALGWPGTVSGAAVVSGDLQADANGIFWPDDPNAPFWSLVSTDLFWSDSYDKLVYEMTVVPDADVLDAMLKLPIQMDGEWSMEYRAASSAPFWSADLSAPFWSADASASFWDDPGDFVQWPGQLDHLRRKPYEIRVCGSAGNIQARLRELSVVFDVPDLVEILENVPISSSGTRLALTRSYRSIVSARLTLEDDGGSAAYAKVMDKSLAGPLIQCFTTAGAATPGTVDVVVHGY